MNSALVWIEHDNKELSRASLHAITAASQVAQKIHVIVTGHDCSLVADAVARTEGVEKVLLVDHAHFNYPLAEAVAPVLVALAADYDYILAAATSAGKDILPRVAALLDVAQISEIIEVVSPNNFCRPIYAGNAIETVQTLDTKVVLTVRHTAFAAAITGSNAVPIENVAYEGTNELSQFISKETIKSGRPELATARRIVSGGRGVGAKENFAIIEALADKLGAAVGASRAAVDAGYISNDAQVGQTGKIVAPDLYIAVGISGAIQHIAGMKESKVIVAINKDENAPIFEVADYGLVGDLFTLIPELTAAL